MLVAIDGPAGSGKSSVARAVAGELGVVNLNTGAAYRAVALVALREGVDLEDGASLAEISRRVGLDGGGARVDGAPVPEEELRAPEVSAAASTVSARPEVRTVLLDVQREAARKAREQGGAVVEGRDIGSVVFPDADLKVFLTASAQERARRRELDETPDDLARRDLLDSTRAVSPLIVPQGAVVIDTTGRSADDVVDEIVSLLG